MWTWRLIAVPSQAALHRVIANEPGLWVVGANGTILNSVDNGDHWTSLDAADVEAALLSIRFNGTTGWIVGDNVV